MNRSEDKRVLNIEASTDKLQEVMQFVEAYIEEYDCPIKAMSHIDIAVEEVFVNIASYAYPSGGGEAIVCIERTDDPAGFVITFTDRGTPYDPLAKEDPDITLSASEREIGGLGIFMTKKLMDDVAYEYSDGCNILKLIKRV